VKTLYRATGWNRLGARKGAHFTERRRDAEAYLDNASLGGPVLATYEVDARHVLDATGRDAFELVAEAELEGLGQGTEREQQKASRYSDARELAEAWRDSGYTHVFHILENATGNKAIGRLYDWVKFVDDFPAGCITWKYVGDDTLQPVATEEPDVPARDNPRGRRSRRRPRRRVLTRPSAPTRRRRR
jgi:hypothetical protein